MIYVKDDMLCTLEALSFEGKGEAFVEARFLTPLLSCLGYEGHCDYEVIRHGDDRSSFSLPSPPVERGAKPVKGYPDFLPTIRKKMFWVIEAKSPKNVSYPFDPKLITQGLQYCVAPAIQAKYLLLTNGEHSCIYDAHASIMLDRDLYVPVLEFKASEVIKRWSEIFELLSVERLRIRLEIDMKAMYDKMCLSSLDKNYPQELIKRLGASAVSNSKLIEKHVYELQSELEERTTREWWAYIRSLSADEVYSLMEEPLRPASRNEGMWYVEQSLITEGIPEILVFNRLVDGYQNGSVFRRLQSYLGMTHLRFRAKDPNLKAKCLEFLKQELEQELPLLNQVECAYLRANHKYKVVTRYPLAQVSLNRLLSTAPELVRHVHAPTVRVATDEEMLREHKAGFAVMRTYSPSMLQESLQTLLKFEQGLDAAFGRIYAQLEGREKPLLGGFSGYGEGGKLYQLSAMFTQVKFQLVREAEEVAKSSEGLQSTLEGKNTPP